MKWTVLIATSFLCAQALFGQTRKEPSVSLDESQLKADERLAKWLRDVREPPHLVVRPGDPHYEVLAQYRVRMGSHYDRDKLILPGFGNWVRVESASALQVFPKLVFYSITWSLSKHPEATKPVSLPLSLKKTVCVDKDTGEIEAEYLDYDALGQLLLKHRVTLRNAADAMRIRKACCELCGTHWPGPLAERTSDTEWRLGISSHDHTVSESDEGKTVETSTSYLQIMVDAESKEILSCERRVNRSYERIPPMDEEIKVYVPPSECWWDIVWRPELWFPLAIPFGLFAFATRRLRIRKNAA